MPTLEKRIEALEVWRGGSEGDGSPRTIFIVGASKPDAADGSLVRITGGGSEWLREPGESEQAFKRRVSREVNRSKPGQVVILAGHRVDA